MRQMGDGCSKESAIYSVSSLTAVIASLLDNERIKNVWVEGEITNYLHHRSGHRYFSLSEDSGARPSVIRCAMWSSYGRELAFTPVNGMRVRVYGSVDLYEPSGDVQIYCARDG